MGIHSNGSRILRQRDLSRRETLERHVSARPLGGTGRRRGHPDRSGVLRSISPMRSSTSRSCALRRSIAGSREIGQLVVVPIDRRRWWRTPDTPAGPIATRLRRVRGAWSLPGLAGKSAARAGPAGIMSNDVENQATIIRWAMAVLMVNRLTGRDLRCMSLSIPDARYASIGARSSRSFAAGLMDTQNSSDSREPGAHGTEASTRQALTTSPKLRVESLW